jgi:hypothetical protein
MPKPRLVFKTTAGYFKTNPQSYFFIMTLDANGQPILPAPSPLLGFDHAKIEDAKRYHGVITDPPPLHGFVCDTD